MQLGAVRGQQRVVDALTRSLRGNRVAHAYLFEGPAGCGRRTMALALIRTLFCTRPVNGEACGECGSCRKLSGGGHPDLQLLSPLPDKQDISIDQIRELQHMLALRPFEAPRKACLIEPAERMNVKSANALLKTLEEPPGHAVIILLTSQADLLLPTIRSRCQHLRFGRLQDTVIADLLMQQGMSREAAELLAPLAEGSMERALVLDVDSDETQRRELLSCLSKADSRSVATVFDTAEMLAGSRDETLHLIDRLIGLIRDLLLIRSTGLTGIAHRFMADALAAEAARFRSSDLIEAVELALATRRAVQGNVNAKLALEHLLLGYDRLRKEVVL